MQRPSHRLDRIGSIASFTCAIHCALMPFVLAVVPAALGASLASGWVEWGLFGASASIGLTSMHRGRKHHRRPVALGVCAVGVSALAIGRLGEERHWGWSGVAVLVSGGLIVAGSHLLNIYLCKRCPVCK